MKQFYYSLKELNLLLFLMVVLMVNAFGQTGNLKGVVKDKVTGEALIDVNIYLPTINKGTLSELEGEFYVPDLPAGKYRVIFNSEGYKSDTVENVVITAGQTTVLDQVLSSDTAKALTVYVIGQKNEGSVATAIEDTKKSDKIISVLSTEQIQKGQDRDAAEAVRRIPGVTLIDGRFIMVRGLSERYNSVWLNDAGAPSSETDNKAFSFDILPSQMIDKIQLYKTPAPDLPGDFAGGMIKIYTRASAQKRDLQINVQGSVRPGSTFNNFNYTAGSSTDFLGFDNGYRELPNQVPSININNLSSADKATISRAFVNDWGIQTKKALPDMRLNIYYTDNFKIKSLGIGSTSDINYANLNTVYKIQRGDYDSTFKVLDYNDIQSTNIVRLSAIQNFVAHVSRKFKLESRHLLNQFGIQQNVLRTSNLENASDIRAYSLLYQSRTIYTQQLSGTLGHDEDKTKYNFTLGYSYNNRNIPDFRRIKYTKAKDAPDSTYTVPFPPGTADPVNAGGRFYSKLSENVYSFNHNLKREFAVSSGFKYTINVGNYLEYKSRHFSARTFGYIIPPSAQSLQFSKLPLDQIFSPQYVGVSNGFTIDEITSLSDKYDAQNALVASYASAYFIIKDKVKVLLGPRLEYNVQSLQSYLNTEFISPSVKTLYLLPSVNASYNFTDKSLIRAAYGKTLNRPEFREWSPFYFYNFDFSAGTYGSLFPTIINPKGKILQVATIQNFDLRYELYPSAGELFNFGIFYKDFKNPIQQVIQVASDDSRAFTFTNANSAYSYGIEMDVRKNLGFLSSGLFSNLDLVLNASLIKSEVYNTNVINQAYRSPLQGQSPYIINAALYYQNDKTGWQGSILYNVYGASVYLFGTLNYPSYGLLPRNQIDITVSKNISKRFIMTLGIQDVLNQPVTIVQDNNNNGKFERNGDDKVIMKYKKGSYFTLGLKYNVF